MKASEAREPRAEMTVKDGVKEHHRKGLVEYREWARGRCKLYKLGGKENE